MESARGIGSSTDQRRSQGQNTLASVSLMDVGTRPLPMLRACSRSICDEYSVLSLLKVICIALGVGNLGLAPALSERGSGTHG